MYFVTTAKIAKKIMLLKTGEPRYCAAKNKWFCFDLDNVRTRT